MEHLLVALISILLPVSESELGANAVALGDVRSEHVALAVRAAMHHGNDRVPAPLLVSIMWGESRFVPGQRTGKVCGVMQVDPADIERPRSDCAIWERDVDAAVAAGVRELEVMLADSRVRGDLRKALLYRACGNAAFDGTCTKRWWPAWVLARAWRLTKRHGSASPAS